MREVMADYVATVHRAYLTQARMQPPAVQGRMPLLGTPFTVAAVGVHNLHVIGTSQSLGPTTGQQVEQSDSIDGLSWTLRFFDPVVIPALGMIDESGGPAGGLVRRTLGVTTHLYHLIVQPGSQLTAHHAGHAGAGLANSHIADARDFDAIRNRARGREALVDEMEGAAVAGLVRAQMLLAREIAPRDEGLRTLSTTDPVEIRRALLSALRAESA
jgi:hypothetical protein